MGVNYKDAWLKTLKAGDKVRTNITGTDTPQIIVSITRDKDYGSGYKVKVMGVDACKCCGYAPPPVYDDFFDADWLILPNDVLQKLVDQANVNAKKLKAKK
jgi:hypothetical protein